MLLRSLVAACLMGALTWPHVALAAVPSGEMKASFALIDEGKYREALLVLDRLRASDPSPPVLWAIGEAAFGLGEFDKSLEARLAFARVNSDWRGMVKLVQTYQAMGRLEERDRQRAVLVDLWKSGKDAELSKESAYRREQFRHAGRAISAFEEYLPAGAHRVVYVFHVGDAGDKPGFRISLGSYDATNDMAQEMGDVPKGLRLYHLDLYAKGYHETLGFYEGLPSYDVVRKAVLDKLDGKTRAMSSSNR